MFNAPGARHGGISCDLTLYIHCCSGEPDEIVSIDLIDFDYPYWHTADDTIDRLSPQSLQTIGAVTLYHLRKALAQ